MTRRTWMLVACAAMLALAGGSAVTASASDHATSVTFTHPVAIPGATLRPGAYIFERVTTDNSLVRVMSRDRSHVYLTQFTRTVDRPVGLSNDAAVTFGEAARGETQPVQAWFPADSPTGQEFVYR